MNYCWFHLCIYFWNNRYMQKQKNVLNVFLSRNLAFCWADTSFPTIQWWIFTGLSHESEVSVSISLLQTVHCFLLSFLLHSWHLIFALRGSFFSSSVQVSSAIIRIVEKPWERVFVDGQPHRHGLFCNPLQVLYILIWSVVNFFFLRWKPTVLHNP